MEWNVGSLGPDGITVGSKKEGAGQSAEEVMD